MIHQKELPGQYHTELQRVLESEAFRHSDSLRRLLEYLGEKSLSGSDSLKEYTIGIEAFNKPQDYDPQQDPTVRVLASKLRHKLDEYYGKEGAGNPVRIEIPRGHYELRFHPKPDGDTTSIQTSLRAQVLKWRWLSFALAACALLLLLLAFHWRLGAIPEKQVETKLGVAWTPELEMIWQPFLEKDHPLLVALGTPMFTKFSGLFFGNPKINEWPEALQSEQLKLLQKDLQSDSAVPSYPYTGVGEATGAFLLCKLLLVRKPDLVLKRSNILSWDDVRNSNVIFLGPPKFNQLLKDIPTGDGFAIERGAIRNPRPQQGEQDAYRSTWSGDQTQLLEDYALIYHLPGLHDHGEIMMLGSASTEGTWAAVEYVTRPAHARDLVDRLKLPSGQLPRSYQVMIRVEFKQQVPWKISYVTHRVLKQPWNSSQAAR
jgi:hypothetical protein